MAIRGDTVHSTVRQSLGNYRILVLRPSDLIRRKQYPRTADCARKSRPRRFSRPRKSPRTVLVGVASAGGRKPNSRGRADWASLTCRSVCTKSPRRIAVRVKLISHFKLERWVTRRHDDSAIRRRGRIAHPGRAADHEDLRLLARGIRTATGQRCRGRRSCDRLVAVLGEVLRCVSPRCPR
jgi:hypothetical protein